MDASVTGRMKAVKLGLFVFLCSYSLHFLGGKKAFDHELSIHGMIWILSNAPLREVA